MLFVFVLNSHSLQEMAKVFPAHFQNSDSYEQLLVFLKDKDSEIGRLIM